MSRVGEKSIVIPEGITVSVKPGSINIKGPLGSEDMEILAGIEVKVDSNILTVAVKGEVSKKLSAVHGLTRALIANIIAGVSKGFKKELEIIGVGYRAVQQKNNVEFSLGFSHPVLFCPPDDVKVKVLEPGKLEVSGINKQKVGQVASNIRKLRPPEPYKGKGIRYRDEYVRRKAGKAGKV